MSSDLQVRCRGLTSTLSLLYLLGTLAGCASAPSALPGSSPPIAISQKSNLTIRIKVARKFRRSKQRPRFIGSATQSINVNFAGTHSVSEIIDLTPASGDCSPASSGFLTCAATIALVPGSYLATIKSYSETEARGTTLGLAQDVPVTVIAGLSNSLAFTLSGIPYQLVVTPLSSSITEQNGVYYLGGLSSQQFAIEAIDDGDIIVGPGAPSYNVTQVPGSPAFTISQPTATSHGSTFSLGATAYSSITAAFTIEANFAGQSGNGCAQNGAVCSASITVGFPPLTAKSIYVGISNNGSDPTGGTVYELKAVSPQATPSSSLVVPGVVGDPSGLSSLGVSSVGTVYTPQGSALSGTSSFTGPALPGVAVLENDTVTAPLRASAAVEYYPITNSPCNACSTISGAATMLSSPLSAASDSAGNIYVGDSAAHAIFVYSASVSGNVGPIRTISGLNSNIADPQSLAIDSSGALWVLDSNSLLEFSGGASGNVAPVAIYSFPDHVSGVAIAADDRGNVYVAAQNEATPYPAAWPLSIQVFTTSFGTFAVLLPTHSGDYVDSIAIGPPR